MVCAATLYSFVSGGVTIGGAGVLENLPQCIRRFGCELTRLRELVHVVVVSSAGILLNLSSYDINMWVKCCNCASIYGLGRRREHAVSTLAGHTTPRFSALTRRTPKVKTSRKTLRTPATSPRAPRVSSIPARIAKTSCSRRVAGRKATKFASSETRRSLRPGSAAWWTASSKRASQYITRRRTFMPPIAWMPGRLNTALSPNRSQQRPTTAMMRCRCTFCSPRRSDIIKLPARFFLIFGHRAGCVASAGASGGPGRAVAVATPLFGRGPGPNMRSTVFR